MTTKLMHWSDLYAGSLHDWQTTQHNANTVYCRRLGIVENMFDSDGTDFEGRADMNARILIELGTDLDGERLHKRIQYVWAVLRNQHVLLASKALCANESLLDGSKDCWLDKRFYYQVPSDVEMALQEAKDSISFVGDHYPSCDSDIFFNHIMNAARVIDEKRCLSRLFVFPPKNTSHGTLELEMCLVVAHEAADGLSMYRRTTDIIGLLNRSPEELETQLRELCSPQTTTSRLPPAQESLYPPMGTTPTRTRWQWLITRVLRHVREPTPPAFENPLRRNNPLGQSADLKPIYSQLLEYKRKPPLSSCAIGLDLPSRAVGNLVRLCKEAGISRGSGSFVIIALVMMRLEENRDPDTPWTERLPFVGSFPLDPRPFLTGSSTSGKEDSVMLAFSDGVVLPFLPSTLDLETSFRVLGRSTHRQLRQYQKRKKLAREEMVLGSRSPGQLLPAMYLATMERLEGKVKPERRVGLNPQAGYPARFGSFGTCGISSIGDRTNLVSAGRYDVGQTDKGDLVADFRDLKLAVRARDGEFLVGTSGTKNHHTFYVSYDGSSIDSEKVTEWKSLLHDILDYDSPASQTEI